MTYHAARDADGTTPSRDRDSPSGEAPDTPTSSHGRFVAPLREAGRDEDVKHEVEAWVRASAEGVEAEESGVSTDSVEGPLPAEAPAARGEAPLEPESPDAPDHGSIGRGEGSVGGAPGAEAHPDSPQTEAYSQWAVVYEPQGGERAPAPGGLREKGEEGGAGHDGPRMPRTVSTSFFARTAPDGGPQYILRRCIGQGGFGEVWEAEQRSLSRLVAVKKVRDDAFEALGGDLVRRKMLQADFRQEALTTGLLDHPNIVPVHDLGVDELGRPLLAMKLIEGRSWDKIIRDEWRDMTVPEFLERHLPILVDVGQAIAFAHSRGIVHRDIKPGQVMVGQFGEVLLTDWGLSLSMRTSPPPGVPKMPALPTRETATNPAGTPSLMAPEQAMPTAGGVGYHTDIYLLGGTLYYLLTGHFPHSTGDSERTMERARAGDVTPPAERNPRREVPPALAELAMRCMAKEPRERPTSAIGFVEELQGYLTGASRRREATRIVAEVAARFEAEKELPSYELLGQSITRLEHAASLWPGQPELRRVNEEVRGAFASLTLSSGDLTLAHHLVETMPLGSERARLRTRLERRAALEAARRRRHRIALGASFVLLLLMLASSGMFTLRLLTQQEEIEARRREALAESGRARRAQEAAEAAWSEAERRRVEVEEGARLVEGALDEARRRHDASTRSTMEGAVLVATLLRELGLRIDPDDAVDRELIDRIIGDITDFENALRDRALLDSSAEEAAARLDLLESSYRDWTVRSRRGTEREGGDEGADGGADGSAAP